MKKNFFYVGLVFVSLGILNTSCSDTKQCEYNVNDMYVDEYGSEWNYVSDNYPYWLITNAEHNTTCRYYPYSGIYTSNVEEGRSNITKPSYVSGDMATHLKSSTVKKSDNTVSQRPRTEYAVNNYYGSSNTNFMTGYLLGSMMSNNYGGSHYVNTHTTHTRTIIKEVPSKTHKDGKSVNTTPNNSNKTFNHSAYPSTSKSSFSRNISAKSNTGITKSSAKSSSKSGGFGMTGRGSSSAS